MLRLRPSAFRAPFAARQLGHKAVYENVADMVGMTPMVKLNRVIGPDCKAKRVLAKLEMQNPGGSVKDRIAKSMIERAEARGEITPGKTTIVEATSGNTGIGVAMIAAAKGYKCIIIMPQLPPMLERYIICRKFGADVHLTAGAIGQPMMDNMFGYMDDLLASNPDYWSPRQFHNEDNPIAHVESTGPEIWEQTEGEVDYFIAGAGTGGTMAGAGKYLKEMNSSIKNVLVEPTESRVMIGNEADKHMIVGIGAGVPLPFIEDLEPGKPFEPGPRGPIAFFDCAASEEAIIMANRLAAEEGLLVGPSTGAAAVVAAKLAATDEAAGKTIVVLFPSSGIRYVTHPMWMKEKQEAGVPLAPPEDPSTLFANEPPVLRWRSEDWVPPEN